MKDLNENVRPDINFLGSGWTVKGVDYQMINILLDQKKIAELKANSKGFVKITVVKKKEAEEGKADFYAKENTYFREKLEREEQE